MLLAIATTHQPATDLGYLLHKHPDRFQSFDLAFGQARVFYPEAGPERCTAVLMLEIDPVKLVRKGRKGGFPLEQYVNDRPYVASSFLSVAIARVFGTALAGRCREKPELVSTPFSLTANLAAVPCAGGEALLRQLFEPLGYAITAQSYPLDETFPDWGDSSYFSVELRHTLPLQTLLSHLYVLIPVLDADKHYWVGEEEVEKLLRHGEGWLAAHPAYKLITQRYLKRQGRLIREALAQLLAEEEETLQPASPNQTEETLEKPLSLNQQRLETVVSTLKQCGAKRILDLGCGEGKLLKKLLADRTFTEIVGLDVSYSTLERARDRLPQELQPRLQLLHGSLTYRDRRLQGYDAATVIEVIEHLDASRLQAFERILFAFTRPQHIVLTTPNIEYNVKFETLPGEKLRHWDHRFEWTRQEFQAWAEKTAETFGYRVQFYPIGAEDPEVGAPTQMGVFHRGT